jgi:hypothetical protein
MKLQISMPQPPQRASRRHHLLQPTRKALRASPLRRLRRPVSLSRRSSSTRSPLERLLPLKPLSQLPRSKRKRPTPPPPQQALIHLLPFPTVAGYVQLVKTTTSVAATSAIAAPSLSQRPTSTASRSICSGNSKSSKSNSSRLPSITADRSNPKFLRKRRQRLMLPWRVRCQAPRVRARRTTS